MLNAISCELLSEAAVQRCSVKKGFLKNFTNTWKTPALESLFNKGAGLRIYWKRDWKGVGVFLWILWNISNIFFYRTPLVAASVLFRYTTTTRLSLVWKEIWHCQQNESLLNHWVLSVNETGCHYELLSCYQQNALLNTTREINNLTDILACIRA